MSESIHSTASQLLCTMGTTWQVVPEAFMRAPKTYQRVCVFTTAKAEIPVEPLRGFFAKYPAVQLGITRSGSLAEIQTGADHAQFEEWLFRWYLHHLSGGPVDVCLAGGYKTMSASMQQAARLFGARRVFHVLADSGIRDAAAIHEAAAKGSIHYIELGEETGWPQLARLATSRFPLIIQPAEDGMAVARPCKLQLRDEVKAVMAAARSADANPAKLPFPAIVTWPRPHRLWLEQQLEPALDLDWVLALPKIELHCHLGGFATHGHLLEAVRAAADNHSEICRIDHSAPPPLPANWPAPHQPISLRDYMQLGDATGRGLLWHPDALRRHCELLYRHFQDQHIIYAEVRCSPNNYTSPDRSAWTVLADIRAAFEDCRRKAVDTGQIAPRVHLILIATRKDGGDRSDISRHLALAITAAQHWTDGVRVVGVDLAGFESPQTRAALYETDFTPVHRVGLAVTVHAGENDDAEGIWQAVFSLNARRIGHGLRLGEAPDLLRAIAERRIGIEMCPYANFQIHGYQPMKGRFSYPLGRYLDAGVAVSANTDNIGISAASLSDNLLFLATLVEGIRRIDLLALQRNALETAFVSRAERDHILDSFHNCLSSSLPGL